MKEKLFKVYLRVKRLWTFAKSIDFCGSFSPIDKQYLLRLKTKFEKRKFIRKLENKLILLS